MCTVLLVQKTDCEEQSRKINRIIERTQISMPLQRTTLCGIKKKTKMKNCLLLGRKGMIVDDVKKSINATDINLFGGTSLQDVKDIFNQHNIDIVIMGAGLDINDRLDIIKYVFNSSKSTTVHMKDWDSGPAGMLPFVNGVVNGLLEK
jgi:hypothetical protein